MEKASVLVFGAVLALALVLALAGCAQKPVADISDTVKVNYIGTFANGTVFDTNIPQEAQIAGIYRSGRQYRPLTVTIGKNQVVPGFEQALIGMRVGDIKTVTIPPEQGYGKESPFKVAAIPLLKNISRYQAVSRIVIIPRSLFDQDHANVSVGENITEGGTSYTVELLNATNATLLLDVPIGANITLPETTWPSMVLNETDAALLVRQDPVNGSTTDTALGNVLVTVTNDTITLRLPFQVGGVWKNPQYGTGRVTAVNATTAIVDFNNPLAGKNLTFQITMLDIQKGNGTV